MAATHVGRWSPADVVKLEMCLFELVVDKNIQYGVVDWSGCVWNGGYWSRVIGDFGTNSS